MSGVSTRRTLAAARKETVSAAGTKEGVSTAGAGSAGNVETLPPPSTPSAAITATTSVDLNSLKPGTRVSVRKQIDDESFFRKAEVMSVRTIAGKLQFYVHFIGFNKRLDEWTTAERMDLATVELKVEKTNGASAGVGVSKAKAPTKSDKGLKNKKQRGAVRDKKANDGGDCSDNTTHAARTDDNASTPTLSVQSEDRALTAEMESLRRGGSMTHRPEEIARVKNVDKIEMGQHQVDAWYFSPYPEDLITAAASDPAATETIVYLCEFCLECFAFRSQLLRHRTAPNKCPLTHPPGNEIYRNGTLSFFEIDGHKQKTYCRRLCLLAKLFLDHKTLFYDVDPFLFYVLTETDARGSRILGYFSKEKESLERYNLACILTLPQHQRKGFGRLLIEFSYELSKREGKIGSPEKPLSDLGLLSYRSFWTEVLVGILRELLAERRGTAVSEISIDQLSALTSFTTDDVVHTLQAIDALRYQRGQHVIVLSEKVQEDWEQTQGRVKCRIDPKCLQWTPPVFTAAQLRFL